MRGWFFFFFASPSTARCRIIFLPLLFALHYWTIFPTAFYLFIFFILQCPPCNVILQIKSGNDQAHGGWFIKRKNGKEAPGATNKMSVFCNIFACFLITVLVKDRIMRIRSTVYIRRREITITVVYTAMNQYIFLYFPFQQRGSCFLLFQYIFLFLSLSLSLSLCPLHSPSCYLSPTTPPPPVGSWELCK